MYQAWSLNWGEKEVMRISGTGVISIEKYIEKKNQLNNQLESFKQLAINESNLIDENARLDSELIQTENKLRKSQQEYDRLRNDIGNSQSTETLNGIWTVRPGFNGNKEMRISISGNDLYEVLEVNKVDKYGRFLFCQNFQERLTICFISNTKTMNFITLNSSNQFYMSGSWNDNTIMEWEKLR